MKTAPVRMFVVLAMMVSLLVAGGAATGGGAVQQSRVDQLAAYWTPERRAAAIPRDLVLDPQGLAYMSLPSGELSPYGHSTPAASPLSVVPNPEAKPTRGGPGGGGGSSDTTPPLISSLDPAGGTIGASYTFSATVTDNVGVKSVTFTVWKDGQSSQSFSASNTSGDTWTVSLTGFTDGNWQWYVTAKDTAKKGGNTATSDTVTFAVDTGGGGSSGGGGGTVTNDTWPNASPEIGRLYFEMPYHGHLWAAYVCSGTVVTDDTTGRSIILTAAHCVYDDANKVFSRNVLFIPDQDQTTGSGTDTNCSNDPYGCWAPFGGVVDVNWTTRTFPDNIPWDYGYYMVADSGAHSGTGSYSALDAVGSLGIGFDASPTTGAITDAIGYSYSDDPDLMYCADSLTTESSYSDWWLGDCGLSGGSSGGPWMQSSDGSGPIMSLNSWGYTNQPGMAGPTLAGSSASCVFADAKSATGDEAVSCP